jgi:hypothetical protein
MEPSGPTPDGFDRVELVNGAAPSAICSSPQEFVDRHYDYLIVGGGTAGLVLAARLTENPQVHVGVVEAGKNRLDDIHVSIPSLFTKTMWNPEYDWMLESIPQARLPPPCVGTLPSNDLRRNIIETGSMPFRVASSLGDRVASTT